MSVGQLKDFASTKEYGPKQRELFLRKVEDVKRIAERILELEYGVEFQNENPAQLLAEVKGLRTWANVVGRIAPDFFNGKGLGR